MTILQRRCNQSKEVVTIAKKVPSKLAVQFSCHTCTLVKVLFAIEGDNCLELKTFEDIGEDHAEQQDMHRIVIKSRWQNLSANERHEVASQIVYENPGLAGLKPLLPNL